MDILAIKTTLNPYVTRWKLVKISTYLVLILGVTLKHRYLLLSSYSFEESLNHPYGYYFFLILEFN